VLGSLVDVFVIVLVNDFQTAVIFDDGFDLALTNISGELLMGISSIAHFVGLL
jgi:hypothetical protein